MSTLTKSDMIEHLMSHLNLTRQEGRCLVENFFDELSESLIDGKEVKLSGFGNFELKDKNSRPGRNPKTGEPVAVSQAINRRGCAERMSKYTQKYL